MRIAISGKMGSGKTTLADELVNKYGFKKLYFAKKVRDVARLLYDLTEDDLYGPNKRRDLLQKVGHGLRTVIHKNVLVDALVKEIEADPDADIVIDDMRYKSEYDALKKLGFVVVRIEAPADIRQSRLGTAWQDPDHPGETDLDDVINPFLPTAGMTVPSSDSTIRSWDVVLYNKENDMNHIVVTAKRICDTFNKKDEEVR